MDKKFTKLELKIIRGGIEKEKQELINDMENDFYNSAIPDTVQIAEDLEKHFTKLLERGNE